MVRGDRPMLLRPPSVPDTARAAKPRNGMSPATPRTIAPIGTEFRCAIHPPGIGKGWRPARSDPGPTPPCRSVPASRRGGQGRTRGRAAGPQRRQLRRGGAVNGTAPGIGAPRRDIGALAGIFGAGGSLTAASIFRGLKFAARLLALARSAGLSLLATSSRFLPASSSPWLAAAENHA